MENTIALFGVVGVISGVLFGYIGYQNGCKKENLLEGEEEGALKADTRYIVRRVDDILIEQKDTNKSLNLLSERVTRVEESAKHAHKRLDEL